VAITRVLLVLVVTGWVLQPAPAVQAAGACDAR
jgi:hypothetical protein